ncbi:GlxA family transcriptional regulator [Tistrella mobilis]|uniref:GlxA family transcriptional regulator n=1 Tax=Tistrella mobilis TaxID=171437 RepID=UPI00355919C5
MREILFLSFPGAQLLDVTGPFQVFATANDLARLGGRAAPYRLRHAAGAGGAVETTSGMQLLAEPAAVLREARPHTLVVAGGDGVNAAGRDADFLDLLKTGAGRAERVASVCSGALLLAAAGLLEGRRATTHWCRTAEFRRRFPAVQLEPDQIWVQDGPVWTSAGITAGIDLALALVEADEGQALARAVARQLVVFLRRPGGQSQFSPLVPEPMTAPEGGFLQLRIQATADPAADLTVPALAERAGMSLRAFSRAFLAEVGETPARWVEGMRLDAARRALEAGAASIKSVAVRSGFGDDERMRRAFLRRLGVTPEAYRSRFGNGLENRGMAAGGPRL